MTLVLSFEYCCNRRLIFLLLRNLKFPVPICHDSLPPYLLVLFSPLMSAVDDYDEYKKERKKVLLTGSSPAPDDDS